MHDKPPVPPVHDKPPVPPPVHDKPPPPVIGGMEDRLNAFDSPGLGRILAARKQSLGLGEISRKRKGMEDITASVAAMMSPGRGRDASPDSPDDNLGSVVESAEEELLGIIRDNSLPPELYNIIMDWANKHYLVGAWLGPSAKVL